MGQGKRERAVGKYKKEAREVVLGKKNGSKVPESPRPLRCLWPLLRVMLEDIEEFWLKE